MNSAIQKKRMQKTDVFPPKQVGKPNQTSIKKK